MWGRPREQPGASPSVPAVTYSPPRLPESRGRVLAPPTSPGPAQELRSGCCPARRTHV